MINALDAIARELVHELLRLKEEGLVSREDTEYVAGLIDDLMLISVGQPLAHPYPADKVVHESYQYLKEMEGLDDDGDFF